MLKQPWDALWINALIATCEQGYQLIQQGAIAVQDNKIAWVGAMSDLPIALSETTATIHDVKGCCITPGLIDCHTHLVYAGNRAHEFEQYLQGATYEEVAKRGGGIQSTVAATREASEDELFAQSLERAYALYTSGVTVLEIKSGYGLDWPTEEKMLRVAYRISQALPLTIRRTFLGAHTLPPEYANRADEYIDLVCQKMIPMIAAKKLADAVDVFCEKIAFNLPQTERIFDAAKKNGLAIKCHSEQLSSSGSAKLAARYHALSVDHLEYLSQDGVEAMAKSGTVAVLLPGAFYFLREKNLPPIKLLQENKIPIAIATDCNPGSSPVSSLLLIMNMACTLFRLTPEEALLAVTQHAAKALGLEKTHGTLTKGKAADFVVWKVRHPAELAYYLGSQPLKQLICSGKIVLKH